MTKTLYLTRNGLLEPLGQSQVFAYLRGLSRHYQITLITYEKDEDRTDANRMAAMQAECDRLGIHWLPQRFHPRPKLIAPTLSMIGMLWLLLRQIRAGHAEVIHARSYIPAAAALMAHRMTGTPFIFDMRALWPEELITVGRLQRGSLVHKVIVAIERACLARAAAVVSLTHAAVGHLRQLYPDELQSKTIEVIPTCADLDKFTLRAPAPHAATVHGCIGTILSGWFRTDWLAAWLALVAAEDPEAKFDIVTRDDAARVRDQIDPNGLLGPRLSITARSPDEMSEAVSGHTVSVMFFTDGLSKLGSAPTRLAEVLGSGIPVVANQGVGDVVDIVRDNRVGVILGGLERRHLDAALSELKLLMESPDLRQRCRDTAERLFSLTAGTDAYRSIYKAILKERRA